MDAFHMKLLRMLSYAKSAITVKLQQLLIFCLPRPTCKAEGMPLGLVYVVYVSLCQNDVVLAQAHAGYKFIACLWEGLIHEWIMHC